MLRWWILVVSLLLAGGTGARDAGAQSMGSSIICDKGTGDRAIEACTDLLGGYPKTREAARAYQSRGHWLMAKGDYDKAIADFDRAIDISPFFPAALIDRAQIWNHKQDHRKAIVDLDYAIREDPENAAAYLHRSFALEKIGKLTDALKDLRQYERLAPSKTDAAAAITRVEAALTDPARPQMAPSLPSSAKPEVAIAKPSAVTATPGVRRVALVIGNTKYQYSAALQNPANDARLLASILEAVGFQSITLKLDLTREQVVQALREFATVADSADWAVIYYSGHGIEFGGVNYLVPVDAQLKVDRDIDFETVDMAKVLSAIEGAKRLRLVILDACRNNPFASQMRRSVATRELGRGLARIEPEGGTLIAYAAKNGETALDGIGKNSPFVEALAQRMREKPAKEIRRMFDAVRDDVLRSTQRKQQPFSYGSLPDEDFYFVQ